MRFGKYRKLAVVAIFAAAIYALVRMWAHRPADARTTMGSLALLSCLQEVNSYYLGDCKKHSMNSALVDAAANADFHKYTTTTNRPELYREFGIGANLILDSDESYVVTEANYGALLKRYQDVSKTKDVMVFYWEEVDEINKGHKEQMQKEVLDRDEMTKVCLSMGSNAIQDVMNVKWPVRNACRTLNRGMVQLACENLVAQYFRAGGKCVD